MNYHEIFLNEEYLEERAAWKRLRNRRKNIIKKKEKGKTEKSNKERTYIQGNTPLFLSIHGLRDYFLWKYECDTAKMVVELQKKCPKLKTDST